MKEDSDAPWLLCVGEITTARSWQQTLARSLSLSRIISVTKLAAPCGHTQHVYVTCVDSALVVVHREFCGYGETRQDKTGQGPWMDLLNDAACIILRKYGLIIDA